MYSVWILMKHWGQLHVIFIWYWQTYITTTYYIYKPILLTTNTNIYYYYYTYCCYTYISLCYRYITTTLCLHISLAQNNVNDIIFQSLGPWNARRQAKDAEIWGGLKWVSWVISFYILTWQTYTRAMCKALMQLSRAFKSNANFVIAFRAWDCLNGQW